MYFTRHKISWEKSSYLWQTYVQYLKSTYNSNTNQTKPLKKFYGWLAMSPTGALQSFKFFRMLNFNKWDQYSINWTSTSSVCKLASVTKDLWYEILNIMNWIIFPFDKSSTWEKQNIIVKICVGSSFWADFLSLEEDF